ncbi:hypothetical protein [Mesorhizobium sp. 131-2-1]|uniref:hypothetical protein n=1 Tax=Mesorhizobium sp. 131-2-1 TaxID=2744518 RepID=UPI001927F869|nr:hypothetical protein [Mesorhizobium sp. 131-2-1]BCG93726.1 hypothetical protein MesoLj131a_25900 [Mesorhizobium sp. 131-2-1]
MTIERGSAILRGFVPWVFVFSCFWAIEAFAQADAPPYVFSRDGEFSSVVLITADADWQEKWNTAVSDIPRIGTVKELGLGDAATVLVLFSGAQPANGRLEVLCKIEIAKPNGVIQTMPEAPCYDEVSRGQRKNVLLANARVEFKVEAGDPVGLWRFRIAVRDQNSSARTAAEIGVRVLDHGIGPEGPTRGAKP